MAISTVNDTYMEYFPLWERARHFIQDIKDVKNPIYVENYLPKPEGMTKDEYNAYVRRAEFCPFTARTAEGFHGMIFRKEPLLTVPKNIDEKFIKNVDGKGSSLSKFINQVSFDILTTGWGGCLVDVPKTEGISQQKAEEYGIFPYITYYKAEDIINFQTEVTNRAEVVTLIVLRETVYVNTKDRFSRKKEYQYRVLEIDDNGTYKQSLYNNSGYLISEIYPTKNGKTLNEIPFFFFMNTNPTVPIFNAIIEVNEAWFRKSADLENGLHWTGVPTPYCIGFEPETKFDENGAEIPSDPIKLGGSQILFFPEGTKQVSYLEFSGAGLTQLATALDKDEERMAILGARIISQQRKYVEALETVRLNRANENSVIATFALEMSDIFTKILKLYLEWTTSQEFKEDEVIVKLNTDYDITSLTPQELQALVSAWQSGAIDSKVLFHNLKEGEIIPNEITYDDMQEAIEDERNKYTAQDVSDFITSTEIKSDNSNNDETKEIEA